MIKRSTLGKATSVALFAVAVSAVDARPLERGHADPSAGACDEFRGRSSALCRQAHRANNRVEQLVEDGRTGRRLAAAERKLAQAERKFTNFTGLPVPGFGPVCEISELADWEAANDMNPLLGEMTIVANTEVGCRVEYDFADPDYGSNHTGERKPIAILSSDAYWKTYLQVTDVNPGTPVTPCEPNTTCYTSSNGTFIVTWISENGIPPEPPGNAVDENKLLSCAAAIGCDMLVPQ